MRGTGLWLPRHPFNRALLTPPVAGFTDYHVADAGLAQYTLSGSAVTLWKNYLGSAGSGNDATVGDAPQTGALINGRNAFTLDGTNDFFGSPAATSNVNFTYFVVFRPSGTTNARAILGSTGSGALQIHLVATTNAIQVYRSGFANAGSSTTGPSAGQAFAVCVTYATTPSVNAYVNGTQFVTNNGTTFNNSRTLWIGFTNSAGHTYFAGDIPMVLRYGSVLSTGDRQTIEAWQRTIWGTP